MYNTGNIANILLYVSMEHILKNIKLLSCMCVYLVAQSCPTLATPRTVAHQTPLSMGILQEYWSGLPYPLPGDLPNPGIEPSSPSLLADSLPSEPPGKHYVV